MKLQRMNRRALALGALAVSSALTLTACGSDDTGTSNGGDTKISLASDRVVVTVFPWMPSGVTLKVRFLDPTTVASAPGTRVGGLIFRIDAQDATGKTLNTLPAEVNLSVRYNDAEVSSLNESNVALSHLTTTNNQWKAAPKQVRDEPTNYVAASILEAGTYVVHVP